MNQITSMCLHHTENWKTLWYCAIPLCILGAFSCKGKEPSEGKHVVEDNQVNDSEEFSDSSKDDEIELQSNETIFDSVFEMVDALLKDDKFPDSPYDGLPVPEGLILPHDVIEISVHLEPRDSEELVGGMSRVDAAESYPGHTAVGERRVQILNGKVVTIVVWRVRLQL